MDGVAFVWSGVRSSAKQTGYRLISGVSTSDGKSREYIQVVQKFLYVENETHLRLFTKCMETGAPVSTSEL
jgi:hypothetical protein